MVSSAFYWHEIEAEIHDRHLNWSFVGPIEESKDRFMEYIESKRRNEIYKHPEEECSEMCKKRGTRRMCK